MTEQSRILNEILERTRAHCKDGGVFKAVFDLDSTLFDVNPRVRMILKSFGENDAVQSKFPEASRILTSPGLNLKNTYKLKDQMIHIGLTKEQPEFYSLLMEFWKTHFFGNDFIHHDEPYEGAIEYVKEIYDAGAHVYYLTGRNVGNMGTGTEKQLRQWGLPLGTRGVLAMKPEKDMDDALFKRDYLMGLPRENVEVWFFENEPVNIELVLREVNHVNVVYFDSVHMEKAQPPGPKTPRIVSFKK